MSELRLDRLEENIEQLLERHEFRRDVSLIKTEYAGNIRKFAEVECGFCAHEKQLEAFESYLENKRTVIRGCNGAGKESVLAIIALYAAFVESKLVLVWSATERQLLHQLWRELRERFGGRLPGELYRSTLRIDGRDRIIAMTAGADSASNLTGYHDAGGVAVLISESQAESVGDSAFDAAERNTVDDNSKIVAVCNPLKPEGRIYEIHASPKFSLLWSHVKISAFDHPNLKENRTVIPGGPSTQWVEEQRSSYGEDSAFFIASCLAEFPQVGSIDSLIPPAWYDNAVARWQEMRETFIDRVPLLSVDPAGPGKDKTAMAWIYLRHVEKIELWRLPETMDTVNRVEKDVRQWMATRNPKYYLDSIPMPRIVVDSNGLGEGIASRMREKNLRVEGFKASNQATGDFDKQYENARAAAGFAFRGLLERGQCSLPADRALREEALAIQWETSERTGRIVLEKKEDLRKRLKRSSDSFDAVTQGLYFSAGRSPSVQRFNFQLGHGGMIRSNYRQ